MSGDSGDDLAYQVREEEDAQYWDGFDDFDDAALCEALDAVESSEKSTDPNPQDPFVVAEEDCLRSTPIFSSPETVSKYKAYVVFYGRLMGVFQTW